MQTFFSLKAVPLDSVKVKFIDGKRFIIHKVDKGQGLMAIGRRYHIDVTKIAEANPGKTGNLKPGEKLLIPVVFTLDSQKADQNNEPVNLVAKSEKQGQKNDHASRKNLHDTGLKVQPDKLEETHANADAKEKEVVKMHVVSKGETLKSIAQKYKITPQLIVKWNGLHTARIEPGQELIVDGSIVIKPYEKWNEPNSVSGKNIIPKNILAYGEEIAETGFAVLGTEKQILHKTLRAGTLLLVTNLDNGKQCYIKVTGTPEKNNTENILVIDTETQKKLDTVSGTIRIKIQYLVP
ncbi:MAG: LysM peptidoglycan-binding domain-containing protein [Bacteroidia bacterium]